MTIEQPTMIGLRSSCNDMRVPSRKLSLRESGVLCTPSLRSPRGVKRAYEISEVSGAVFADGTTGDFSSVRAFLGVGKPLQVVCLLCRWSGKSCEAESLREASSLIDECTLSWSPFFDVCFLADDDDKEVLSICPSAFEGDGVVGTCSEDLSCAEPRSVLFAGAALFGVAIVLCSVPAEDFRRFGVAAVVDEKRSSTEGWLPTLFSVAELVSSGAAVLAASSASLPALEDT